MVILQILSATITGTSLMTLYIYLVAIIWEKSFKPPALLNHMVTQSPNIKLAVPSGSIVGWIIHYSIGLAFTVIYYFLWQFTFLEPTFLHGALMGLVSGVAGITGWAITFLTHSNPPQIDLIEYYLQLLIAHVFLGIGAVAGYNLF